MKPQLIQTFLAAWMVAAGFAASAQDTNAVTDTNTPVSTTTNTSTNAAVTTPVSTATDFHSFDLITKRNIFDPTRSGTRPSRAYVRPPRVDSFTLVGTMSYEKGRFAFFDGSSSEFRKTLKLSDKIAGYKITAITDDHILLAAASNQVINLPVGTRMRRQEGSPWKKTGGVEPDATPTPSASASSMPSTDSSATPAASSPGESDAMKRMMAKRLSEK